jgi:4-oxalocrotonate tautomerase
VLRSALRLAQRAREAAAMTRSRAVTTRHPEERTMPHVVVKLMAGRSEQQKRRLADAIVKDVTEILNVGEESVSVAIEDVLAGDWTRKIYERDIVPNWDKLYKEPGYDPSE